jgi:hypothetical protein
VSDHTDQYARLDRQDKSRQKEHADRLMFRVTLASTIVAVVAAGAAVWTGYEARMTRIGDERPYVTMDLKATLDEAKSARLNKTTRTRLHVSSDLTASGRSPARNVQISCARTYGLSEKDFDKVRWPPQGLDNAPFVTVKPRPRNRK